MERTRQPFARAALEMALPRKPAPPTTRSVCCCISKQRVGLLVVIRRKDSRFYEHPA